MTAVYADPAEHAAWLLHNICDPLPGLTRTDLDAAFTAVATLTRQDLEALALILAAAHQPGEDLARKLRWLTDPVRWEHRDEWSEAPRPLVVHRA